MNKLMKLRYSDRAPMIAEIAYCKLRQRSVLPIQIFLDLPTQTAASPVVMTTSES